jgi:hypothetical protein
MLPTLKTSLWRQYGAAIDYLTDTIAAFPDDLWTATLWTDPGAPPAFGQPWYRAYHALFWLDLYLTGTEDGFAPPAPFLLIEQWEAGPIPERPYTPKELLDYAAGCRARCRATIDGLTEATLARPCAFGWGECSFLELQIYSLRHVQEHAAQLNMLLGQHGIRTADYPPQAGRRHAPPGSPPEG